MTTGTFDVGGLFSVVGARGIERQLQRVAGVGRVSVNRVSDSTTVVYASKMTNLAHTEAHEIDFGRAGWRPHAATAASIQTISAS